MHAFEVLSTKYKLNKAKEMKLLIDSTVIENVSKQKLLGIQIIYNEGVTPPFRTPDSGGF